jgi:hypothetical protein
MRKRAKSNPFTSQVTRMTDQERQLLSIYSSALASVGAGAAAASVFSSAGAASAAGSASEEVQRVYISLGVIHDCRDRCKQTRLSLKSCMIRVESL